MIRFLIQRLFQSLATLFVFVTVMFFAIQLLMPYDFTARYAMVMNKGELEALQEVLGLTRPVWQRYIEWLSGIISLDLGVSFTGAPVIDRLGRALVFSLLVFLAGTVISFLLGQSLGKWTAWRGSGRLTNLITLIGLAFYTTFPPWLAYLVVITFVPKIRGWVNVFYGSIQRYLAIAGLSISRSSYFHPAVSLSKDPITVIGYMALSLAVSSILLAMLNVLIKRMGKRPMGLKLFLLFLVIATVCSWLFFGFYPLAKTIVLTAGLPIVTFVLMSFAETMLIMRTSMEDVVKEDYVTVAIAKGVPERVVRDKHVARNAILPVLGRLVVTLPYLLTGIVILEYVFGWPGMGSDLWYAIQGQDVPLVMGYLLFIGLISMAARLALDVIHAYLDPRVRFGEVRIKAPLGGVKKSHHTGKSPVKVNKEKTAEVKSSSDRYEQTRALKIARKLLQEGRFEEAQHILVELLKRDLNHESAWYLLSFTTPERKHQAYALRQALRINPDHAEAKDRLAAIAGVVEVIQPSEFEIQSDFRGKGIPKENEKISWDKQIGRKQELRWQSTVELDGIWQPQATYSKLQRLQIRVRLVWQRWLWGWGIFAQSRLALLGLGILSFFVLMIVIRPILMATVWPSGIYGPITAYDPNISHPSLPSAKHILGTTMRGKDVLSLLMLATQHSFILGLAAGLTSAVTGTALGGLAAYNRGRVDAVLSRLSDVFLLLPAPIFMAFASASLRGLSVIHLGVIYGLIAGLGNTAILMRTHALTVISRPYIEAARVAGGSSAHIILRHVLPHLYPMAALQMLLAVTGAVVVDGFLSFLGVTRYVINWGTMLYESAIIAEFWGGGIPWHIYLPPIIAFSFFGLAFFLISRGMQRVANPRLREQWVY